MPPPTTLLFSMWSCLFLGPVDFRIIIPHLLTVLSLLTLCPFVHWSFSIYQLRNRAVYSLQYICVVKVVNSTDVSRGSLINLARGVFYSNTYTHEDSTNVFIHHSACLRGGRDEIKARNGGLGKCGAIFYWVIVKSP